MNKLFNIITAHALFLILIGVGGTFLSDYLNSIDWFGDYTYQCQIVGKHYHYDDNYVENGICNYYRGNEKWGARHFWYNWGLFFLFMISLIRGVAHTIYYYNKNMK